MLEELHVAADDEEVIPLLVHDFVAHDECVRARVTHREGQGDGHARLHRRWSRREIERVLARVERIARDERHAALPAAAALAGRHLRMHRAEEGGESRRRRWRGALLRGGAQREQYDQQQGQLISSHSG